MRFQIHKVILLSVMLASCTSQKVAFTSDLQQKYCFSEEQLKKVQFYTSTDIILTKTETDDEASIINGKVLVVDKQKNETIIIRKNTPCVLVKILSENKFLFSFEYGEHRALLFGNNEGGYYSLMAKNWKVKHGVIHYANKTYITTNGDVYLTISSNVLRQVRSKERVLYGRHI